MDFGSEASAASVAAPEVGDAQELSPVPSPSAAPVASTERSSSRLSIRESEMEGTLGFLILR
jgi:hypothetical protein